MAGSALVVEDVSKSYGRRRALDGVSFRLEPGVTALLGPNGAGKSTLIRALATVEGVDGGSVTSGGRSLKHRGGQRAYRRRLGWLPQTFAAPMQSSLREFVDYVGWLKEVPRHNRRSAVETAIESVGLSDRIDDTIASLSGGMLRRLGLAQAVVNDPPVLLLDEPTAGLDPRQRLGFASLVTHHATAAVLLATHLLEDVALMADTLLVLDSGRLLFTGTLTEFCQVADRTDVTVELLSRRFSATVGTAL